MSSVNFTTFRRKVTSNGEGCLGVYDDIERDINKKFAELDELTDKSLFTKKCEEIYTYLDDQKHIYGLCYKVHFENPYSYIAKKVENLLLESIKYSECPRKWKSDPNKITKLENKKDEPRDGDGDGKHGTETTEMEKQRISKSTCEDESCVQKNLERGEVSHGIPQNVEERGITADGSSESPRRAVLSDNPGNHTGPISNDCPEVNNHSERYVFHENDNFIVLTAKAEHGNAENVVNLKGGYVSFETKNDDKNYGNTCVSIKLLRDKFPNQKYNVSRTIYILGTNNYNHKYSRSKVNPLSPVYHNKEQTTPDKNTNVEGVSTPLEQSFTQEVDFHSQNTYTAVQLKPVSVLQGPANSANRNTINDVLTSSQSNNPSSDVDNSSVSDKELDAVNKKPDDFPIKNYIPMIVAILGIIMLFSVLLKVKRSFHHHQGEKKNKIEAQLQELSGHASSEQNDAYMTYGPLQY